MKLIKRQYTQAFKDEAVRLVTMERLSVPEAARRLEMSDKTLGGWLRRARRVAQLPAGTTVPERRTTSVSELEMEVSKLRAENARLKMEKEILKKATAFFVKESA